MQRPRDPFEVTGPTANVPALKLANRSRVNARETAQLSLGKPRSYPKLSYSSSYGVINHLGHWT
jgi:hypothetical protein